MLNGEKGSGLWWGTKHEYVWTENQLDLFTLYTIKEQSILLYDESHLDNIPSYSKEEFISFFKEYAKCMRKFGKGNSLHSVDWGILHLSSGWKENLKRCKELRKDPSMVTRFEYSESLSNLERAIIEASHDLDRVLETTIH